MAAAINYARAWWARSVLAKLFFWQELYVEYIL